jgi:hypothetical protein
MGKTFSTGLLTNGIWQDSSNNIGIGGAANASFKLQVTGATNLTGALSGTSATFSGSVTANGTFVAGLIGGNIQLKGSTDGFLGVNNSNTLFLTDWATTGRGLQINLSTGAATFSSSVTAGAILSTGVSTFSRTGLVFTLNPSYAGGDVYSQLQSTGALALAAGGDNNRLYITSGGNVGIGTTSPYTRFQVNGGNASIQSDSTGATDGTGDVRRAGFAFRHASADLISALINTTAVADWGLNLHFNTRQFNAVLPATPAMTITAGQNVGIGTSSPAYKLDVNGTARVNSADGFWVQSGSQYRQMYFDGFSTLYFWNGSNQANLSSAGAWVNASDQSIKKDVIGIKYGLPDLMLLNPCSYKMKADNLEQIGFIAQEVEQVIPELVNSDNKGMKGLSYGNMVAVLVKAIQEQQAQIEELKAIVATK